MATYHVLAAVGDVAEEHRSLGVFEAGSAWEALDRCLADHDQEPEFEGVPPELAQAAREDRQMLRHQMGEPGAYFIATPVDAETHFMRDHAGVVREAAEVEQRRPIMRREFGVDVLHREVVGQRFQIADLALQFTKMSRALRQYVDNVLSECRAPEESHLVDAMQLPETGHSFVDLLTGLNRNMVRAATLLT
jgi:hypothetical protein